VSHAECFPKVYDELRRLAAAKLAGERSGHTLDATALVHEAWLKLGGESFGSKSQYIRMAAVAMERILVDHARAKWADKRGGGRSAFALDEGDRVQVVDPDTLLTVHEALETLAATDSDSASLARLRLFAGLSVEEAGESLGLSRATSYRDWAFAKAWLSNAVSSP
jgi:RNA polymerase sigma factor (TIGR02999 family)